MTGRIYRNVKRKDFRRDVTRYPQREKIVTTRYTPFGKVVETKTAEYKREEHRVPKEENGDWETTFQYGRLKIRHSKTEDRYWLFYGDDFLEEVSLVELYGIGARMLKSIGAFTEKINGVHNGKRYTAFQLMAESRWKDEHA